MRRIEFNNPLSADGGRFCVTDDAVVDFCVQEDARVIGRGGDAELFLCNGSFTKHLFRRLIEASSVSPRTQPPRITVSPVPVEDEDLRDFEKHLSYRHRGEPSEQRVYDFSGEQHGADASMHLQMVLSRHPQLVKLRPRAIIKGAPRITELTMVRARRPSGRFL